jgi:cation transport ATPase
VRFLKASAVPEAAGKGGYAAAQGALLLVLFNVSHALEHALTERAQGDLAGLLERAPQTAALVTLRADGAPDLAALTHARAADVPVGACMLVRPGEQVRRSFPTP